MRNAEKYDYPVAAAIGSVLPLCNEFVVCLGNSEDGTEVLINSLQMLNNVKGGVKSNSPLKIIHSVLDDSLRQGGRTLAIETDKAFDAVAADSDWAFYIQADEVIHEKDLPIIQAAMERHLHNREVECLVFKYLHFYGSYNYVGNTRQWYRREIRIIRNDKTIRAYRDAQGFRRNAQKLKGALIDASVYHYGWVRSPYFQAQKQKSFYKFWHQHEKPALEQASGFDYSQINSLTPFDGTHPKIMQARIAAMDWDFEFDARKKRLPFKEKLLAAIERLTGRRLFEFRNYRLVK